MSKSLTIGFDAKRYFFNHTGLGNYSRYVIDGYSSMYPADSLKLFSPRKVPSPKAIVPRGGALHRWYWRTLGMVDTADFKSCEIYHGLSNELPLKGSATKKIVTIHDVIFRRAPELYSFWDRWIYHWKTKKACAQADKIIAVSAFTKQDLMKYYGVSSEKIEVVYQDSHPQFGLPVEPCVATRTKYNLPKDYVLCVGTIEERKSQLTLIQAIEHTDYPLVLVGKKTNYWKQIASYLESRPGLKARVLVLDQADFKDFPALYRMARVFVYPSRLEGFGIPVLEALHVGTPVVTRAGTVMEEALGNAGLLFKDNDLADLTAQIKKLYQDDDLRKACIEEGKKQVLKFSKEKTITQLHHIYHALL